MDDISLYLEPAGKRSELFVLIHGMGNLSNRLADARSAIRETHPHADILAPRMPYGDDYLCAEKPETIVASLVTYIDALYAERGAEAGYRSIAIVGHSLGAVLARKLVIIANGEQTCSDGDVPAPFEPEFAAFRARRAWADKIDRLVLLAGMNRGWTAASTMDWLTGMQVGAAEFFGDFFMRGRLTAFAIRRGAPFLVQTRLQWLSLMDPDYGGRPALLVVQLLGTADDMVSPDDNVDYAIDLFENSARKSYFYLEVSHSSHSSIVQMGGASTEKIAVQRAERRTQFLQALHASREQLATICIKREQMADNLPPEPDSGVKDVVFVVHGIRDKGFWTQKLARKIKEMASDGRKIASWTESYGYFAMLPFLFPRIRQRKVEWLMDRYVEARGRFPKATFHFVGHSNGTYLAAKGLRDYPAVRFERVVFAGSVVRTDFPWNSLMHPPPGLPQRRPQVGKVLNYVATGDWVVAGLTHPLRIVAPAQLGGAGHRGFDQASEQGPVYQVNYIPGSHGTGHHEDNWEDIANFVLTGQTPEVAPPRFSETQDSKIVGLGKVSVLLAPAVLLLVLAFGMLQFLSMFGVLPLSHVSGMNWLWWMKEAPTANGAALRAMGFLLYLMVVTTIVTRV